MLRDEMIELDSNAHFYDIGSAPILIQWEPTEHASLFSLGAAYFNSAYYIAESIITSERDNIKLDMWFLPCIYLYRQSLELTIKALAAKKTEHRLIGEMLKRIQHKLEAGLEEYLNNSTTITITSDECDWIKCYIHDLESSDRASALFRYPFNEEFLENYNNGFLDIEAMVNGLINAYTILTKEYAGDPNCKIHGDVSQPARYIVPAKAGLNNCYLWEPIAGNRYVKQITGYSEAAYDLYQQFLSIRDSDRGSPQIMPILFLLRNCVELQLKGLLYIEVEHKVDDVKLMQITKSHVLYQKLWKTLRPILEYYGNESGQDNTTLDTLDHHIQELSRIDKNGDVFRYPFSYNLQYRLCDRPIDIDKAVCWMLSIVDALDGCSQMLTVIKEYEGEMRSYY